MQSTNQVVILGVSIFEKLEQTVESNHSADRVRKKKPPSYFAVATWTSIQTIYSLLLQCSGCVQSKNGVDLVEVSIFYKSEKMRGQRPIKIKTVYSVFLSYHGCLVFGLVL